MSRYIVTFVSVGDAGLTARPAVFDTETGRTVKVYRRTERHLAERLTADLNDAERLGEHDTPCVCGPYDRCSGVRARDAAREATTVRAIRTRHRAYND